jgi:hypothetical protein
MIHFKLGGLYAADTLKGLQGSLMAAAINCTAGNAPCVCPQAPAVEAETEDCVVGAFGMAAALVFANASRDVCVHCV